MVNGLAEYDRATKINYLHQEIAVLNKLASRHHVARLYYCERCDPFSFMLTTLYGKSIWSLRQTIPSKLLTAGSAARIAVHTLYQLKQLHEVGYILRDLKVGDMLIGLSGNDAKVVFLVDFGMCRTYVTRDKNGNASIRPPREKAFVRGILRYCSPRVHQRKDVSRADDLWSLIYVAVDLVTGLPWRDLRAEEPVASLKAKTSDENLLKGCPEEWMPIMKHVRSLKFESRPNYKLIFDHLRSSLVRLDTSYSDPWDWDLIGKDVVVESLPSDTGSAKERSEDSRSESKKSRHIDKEESSSSSSDGKRHEHSERGPPPNVKEQCSPGRSDPFGKLVQALQKSEKRRIPASVIQPVVMNERRIPASEYDPAFPTTNPAEFQSNDIGV
ncbi:putative serine/threonine-protein kinase [Toxocara canis]|uniref:Putative serine/threonine-protein kinase n=1 Tax=Toxocara canis TaxID=6265 RepID=A0A0B2V4Z8_TOXCA|nr:putative serine/threonine-protein kinase [Toxocara canis]